MSGPRATASRPCPSPSEPIDPFFNANRPEDLATAAALLAAEGSRLADRVEEDGRIRRRADGERAWGLDAGLTLAVISDGFAAERMSQMARHGFDRFNAQTAVADAGDTLVLFSRASATPPQPAQSICGYWSCCRRACVTS